MVKYELKRHDFVEKPYTIGGGFRINTGTSTFVSPGIFTVERDIAIVPNNTTNDIYFGGSAGVITATSPTLFTENLEVEGEIRTHGGVRFDFETNRYVIWDANTQEWLPATINFRRNEPIFKPKFSLVRSIKKLYNEIIQRLKFFTP